MACSKHIGKPYEMVCYSCNQKLVCHECIEKKHIGHKFVELKTSSAMILSGLRKQKKENSDFAEIQRDLKDCQTLKEKEQELAKHARAEIIRRRDLLKRIIDEMAENLLQEQEKLYIKISSTLEEHEREDGEKVQEILQFQSKLAELEKSDDYINVIKTGKKMHLPKYVKHLIPSMMRMTLRPGCAIDREQIRKAFGPVDIDYMNNSYIVHPIQVASVYSVSTVGSLDSNDLFGDIGRMSNITNPTREPSLDLSVMDNDVGRRQVSPVSQVSPQTLDKELQSANGATCGPLNQTTTYV